MHHRLFLKLDIVNFQHNVKLFRRMLVTILRVYRVHTGIQSRTSVIPNYMQETLEEKIGKDVFTKDFLIVQHQTLQYSNFFISILLAAFILYEAKVTPAEQVSQSEPLSL